jgi:hypothetical protein
VSPRHSRRRQKDGGDTEQTENYPVKEAIAMSMTRPEIKQKIDELVNKYRETHDKELLEDIYELACELEQRKMERAIAVLEDVLNRCRREDMRMPEVFAALDFLEPCVSSKWPFDQFRKSLDSNNEEGRWQNVNASLNAVKLAILQRT